MQFQPTPPARTETGTGSGIPFINYISTHSAREDGDHMLPVHLHGLTISTHSAREDGDAVNEMIQTVFGISTHSAREDGDHRFFWSVIDRLLFQPTPPARTETLCYSNLQEV